VAVDVVDRRGPDSGPDGEDLDLDRWGLLAASAAYGEGVRRPAELGLAFVDEAEITELAAGWLQSDHPTDVLAFPVETSTRRALRAAPAGDAPLLMGDVIVCPPVAAARPARRATRRLTRWPCSSCTVCCTCLDTTTPARWNPSG